MLTARNCFLHRHRVRRRNQSHLAIQNAPYRLSLALGAARFGVRFIAGFPFRRLIALVFASGALFLHQMRIVHLLQRRPQFVSRMGTGKYVALSSPVVVGGDGVVLPISSCPRARITVAPFPHICSYSYSIVVYVLMVYWLLVFICCGASWVHH